jgi:trimethylamine--corrinoid protein Co-methyltransferase
MKQIRSSVEVLSAVEIESVHAAALRILEKTGFRVHHPAVLELCRERGALVDESLVRLSETTAQETAGAMRAELTTRNAALPPRKFEGMISTQVFVVDYATAARREGTLGDVKKGIALAAKLENFPIANTVVVPADVPAPVTDVVAFQQVYTYSPKPGGTYVLTPESGRHILELAAIAGRQVHCFFEPVTPLTFRRESLELALLFAARDMPFYIGPMLMGGSTAPVTPAGIMALHCAEIIASAFLIRALTGKFDLRLYNSGPHMVDPRSMICSFGSPNQALLGVAVSQMERFYGLEPACNAGLTDALVPDFQAGFEKASSAAFAFLAGARGLGCQGLVGADQGFSFEQLVLDNEWLSALNHVLRGFDVNEETLAVELIDAIGPAGNFLAEEHTARHMRPGYFASKVFHRDDWENWLKKGSRDAASRARDEVERLTAGYREAPPVCSAEQAREMERIVEAAYAELAAIPLDSGQRR